MTTTAAKTKRPQISILEAVKICETNNVKVKDALLWRKKFIELRRNAPYRGASCTLTLDQYVKLAVKAGIKSPTEIGKGSDNFNLSRKGDVGDYTFSNCRFILKSENLEEKHVNGGIDSAAEKKRGRTKLNDLSVLRQSKKMSKTFRVVSPSGEVFKGLNLKEFCKQRGLTATSMFAVCRGDQHSAKGWTGKYT